MDVNTNATPYVSNAIAVVMTAVQTNQVFQIISMVLTILSILVSFAYTIYKWYKSAKEDGKITPNEIKEILEKGGETANQIIDVINDYNDKKGQE